MSTVTPLHRAALDPPRPALDTDVAAAAQQLAAALAATAVERDRRGGHAHAERELIRGSGLLALSVPQAYGGLGAGWPTVLHTVRTLAAADSALAHVYAFHHLQVASVLLYGDAEQQQRLLGATVQRRLFWGNALNPLDTTLIATRTEGGWRLDGTKRYASGSVGSDRLTLSAHVRVAEGERGALLIGNLPTGAAGVEVREDWDSFGQRQTDSGSVRFEAAFLPDADVLQAPGAQATPRMTLRPLVSQLIMANLYLGLAQAAFEAARGYLHERARPWFASGVARAVDDPYVQHRSGELWLKVRAAQLAADAAAQRFQQALDRGDAVTAGERAEAAIAAFEAKALAHHAGIEVPAQVFELIGAGATSTRLGFDRFWRNARVHTLHDPVDYKLRDIGRWQLLGQPPEPTPYS
jgi:alkylation response protein AidB-like acyl-CoA dehydrogenase